MEGLHQTQQILIETVLSLAHTQPIRDIKVDEVLNGSGISRGSLYHHFDDYNDLIDVAQIYFFSQLVDDTISAAVKNLRLAKTHEEWRELDKALIRKNNSSKRRKERIMRAHILANSFDTPKMMHLMQIEQDRLTGAMSEVYREVTQRGWGNTTLDPETAAIFMQSQYIGRLIGDLTKNGLSDEKWLSFLDKLNEDFLYPGI